VLGGLPRPLRGLLGAAHAPALPLPSSALRRKTANTSTTTTVTIMESSGIESNGIVVLHPESRAGWRGAPAARFDLAQTVAGGVL